jgi:hypothetical protein
MTREQRTERIGTLTRELAGLLAEEGPQPQITFLNAADLPGSLIKGLKAALRRKLAETSPTLQ